MALNSTQKNLVTLLVAAAVVIVAYVLLTMPDRRNASEKVGDAIHELPNGVDKAARQLEDRTPGQRIGDAVKDAGDTMKDSTRSKE